MNKRLSSDTLLSPENKIKLLLAEYQAIEQMHIHYDVLNMSITAIVTAGILTLWGIIIQTAFHANSPYENIIFVNSISILSIVLFAVLSVWIRYTTIHRCIIIRKLNRSHEIEKILSMKQNLMFQYSIENLRAPLDSDNAKRRPGGHTLELLLYFFLCTLGGSIAIVFQYHISANLTYMRYILVGFLWSSLVLSILWITFCKSDVVTSMKGSVEVGLPWSLLFIIIKPMSIFLRWFFNLYPKKF